MLSRTCVALLATALIATPAMARDKTLYLGVEAGPMWAGDLELDANTSNGNINLLDIDHKLGYDFGVIFGYDAGIVRAELDLSYKRAAHDKYEIDDGEAGTINIDADGNTRYIAIMTNLLLDLGNEDGFS